MVVTSDPVGRGQKEIREDWPFEEGLILGTTKIDNRISSLVPEDRSVVFSKERVGLDI